MSPRFTLYVKQALKGGDNGSCPFCMRVYMTVLQKNNIGLAIMSPRFTLYVKQALKGGDNGSCPFCMRVYMTVLQKTSKDNIKTIPVDFENKTEEFLKLNPAGTTPVLIDHGAEDKVIADSALIVEYLDKVFPEPAMRTGYSGPETEALGTFFGKFAGYMKNKDMTKSPELKQLFETEFSKVENYLQNDGKGKKFLLGDNCSDLDCSTLPKLLQINGAGQEYKGIDIAKNYPGIAAYIERMSEMECVKCVRPINEDLIAGWARHGAVKEC